MEKSFYPGPARWVWVAFFVVLTSTLLAGGYAYYRYETERIRQAKYDEIAAIAKLKAGQIREWRQERLADVGALSRGPMFKRTLEEWLRDRTNEVLLPDLKERLAEEQRTGRYANAILLSPDGQVLLSTQPQEDPLSPSAKVATEEALTNRSTVLSDLYRDPKGTVLIDSVAPILDRKGQLVAAVLFGSNAESLLYPLIQSWPTSSRTAETLLIRKDGDEILFLNHLRHRPNTALALRKPLNLVDLPAVQAVLGKQGVFQGRDYRGVDVLADLRPVPDSPWFMVAKVDTAEILAEARYRGAVIALFSVLSILLAAGVTAYGHRYRQARLYQQLYRSERAAQKALQEQYEELKKSRQHAAFQADLIERSSQPLGVGYPDGRLGTVNEAFCRLTGYSRDELATIDWAKVLTPPEWRDIEEAKLEELHRTDQPVRYEKEYVRKDGNRVAVELLVQLVRDESGAPQYYYAFINDITERKRSEGSLQNAASMLRGVLDASPVGIVLTQNRRIQWANAAWEKMFGFDKECEYMDQPTSIMHSSHENYEHVRKIVYDNLNPGEVSQTEARLARKDGTSFDAQVSVNLIEPSDPSKGSISAISDISQRKRAEEGLRESEERFRQVFEQGPLGVAMLGLDYRWVSVNPKLCEMLGYTWDELTKLTFVDITHPDDVEADLDQHRKVLQGEIPVKKLEKRYIKKTGDILWTCLTGSLVRDEQGRASYFLAMIEDITDRKQAEASLRGLLDFRQTLIDSIPNPVFYKDVDGKYIGCNEAFAALVGLPKEDVVGRSVFEVVPKDLADLWLEKDRELFDGPHVQVFECTVASPDGTERSTVFHKAPIFDADGAVAGLIGVVVDITDRRRAEEALRQSEEWYRALVENSFDGIFIQRGSKIVFANSHLYDMLGYSQGELEGLDHWLIYHPEYQQITRERAVARMGGEDVEPQYEVKLQRRDGSSFDGEISARVVNVKGEPGVQVWVKDVSKRKRTEEAQRRLATAVEQSAEAIVVSDTTGNIQWVNPAFERITGYTREEVVGHNSSILKSGEHNVIFYRNLWETIKSGQVWKGRFINKRKDGSLYQEDSTISPVLDSRGKIINFVAVKRDITEQLALSGQLLQAQKMEAIGTLAGGIAHDFNNLLQVILGYSELLMEGKREDDPEHADLSKILQSARSGAELVQRMLTFSRKVEPKPIPLNLNRRILQVEKLLRRTIPRMIDIQMDLSDDLMEISVDPTQMEQVLMNLGVNARDAMPDGGKLIVGTKNVTLDEDYCRLHAGAKPGEYVLLTVSDTGSGMDKETIDHIFEPFYTTKELGRGTGLGLAMVYGIVKQHGGYITCYSEVEHGTTFNVYLPALESEVEPDIEKTSVMPAFGTETVLLVDDEELVRNLGARILSKAGYQVLTATNGKEALDLFEKERGQLSLVILDLIMPVMGGKECVKELLKIDPQAKVLIASGFSADASTKESVAMGVRGFVNKPFRMKELLRQVRKVLDES